MFNIPIGLPRSMPISKYRVISPLSNYNSSSIHKYNISVFSRLSDFVHQYLKCDLNFVTCQCNYVFSKKPVSSYMYSVVAFWQNATIECLSESVCMSLCVCVCVCVFAR